MKKFFVLWIVFLCSFSVFSSPSFASQDISREQAFLFLGNYLPEVPESFQYISLKYSGIAKDSAIEDTLQKMVYLDLLPNRAGSLKLENTLSQYEFKLLSSGILDISLSLDMESAYSTLTDEKLLEFKRTFDIATGKAADGDKITITISGGLAWEQSLGTKEDIFYDVYSTLKNSHYNHAAVSSDDLTVWAIQGMAEAMGDKYTSYFPPSESEDLFEILDGEYEGIGAYVDMPEPGKFMIVSPISGSPAADAGLKGGDQVIKVDEKEITPEITSKEVISWIKGPKGSSVKLTVLRDEKEMTFDVIRQTIIIKDIEYSKPNTSTALITIKNFGERVDTDFYDVLGQISEDTSIKKIIIDLRNNPGGYLDKVSAMLGSILPEGVATAIVESEGNEHFYRSLGRGILDATKYEIILLQNSGTASASEIMIGTLDDYYPEIVIMGEKSYGKGSVQTLKSYQDGSTLKYTSAKWFTGNTKKWIDGVGITPDVEVIFDTERYQKYKKDNQLEKAINY